MEIVEKKVSGYETVVVAEDQTAGYQGIIAIHNTRLGPALGGTRLWHYADEAEGLTDALRLSRGMTYKNALAGLPLGGGKSIIFAPQRILNRERLFRAHGRFVDSLGGNYITAEDVATTTVDMGFVSQETKYVVGLAEGSGDPSPFTARGVFRAIVASAKYRWNSEDLKGKTVALQGCGNVGFHLARELQQAGVKLVVTDIDPKRVKKLVREFNAEPVAPEEIYSAAADIFAPCALGGVINDQTIPQLKVEIVAGAANNQLLENRHGEALAKRGILYAPDYVANAGGVINVCIGALGWERSQVAQKVQGIYDTLLSVFRLAEAREMPTSHAADQLAERQLGTGISTRGFVSARDLAAPALSDLTPLEAKAQSRLA